jgi:hypothetical protein
LFPEFQQKTWGPDFGAYSNFRIWFRRKVVFAWAILNNPPGAGKVKRLDFYRELMA